MVVVVHHPVLRPVLLLVPRLVVGDLDQERREDPRHRGRVPRVLRDHPAVVVRLPLLLRVVLRHHQLPRDGTDLPHHEFRVRHDQEQELLEEHVVLHLRPVVEEPGLLVRLRLPAEVPGLDHLRLPYPVSVHRQVPLRRLLRVRLHLQEHVLLRRVDRPVQRHSGQQHDVVHDVGLPVARLHLLQPVAVQRVHVRVEQGPELDVHRLHLPVRQPALRVVVVPLYLVAPVADHLPYQLPCRVAPQQTSLQGVETRTSPV